MRDAVFLAFTRQGVDRMTKREPTLRQGEYLVRVVLRVPDTVFKARPVPVARAIRKDPDVYTCCLCGRILPSGADADAEGARVDRCSPYGASYEFWQKQWDYGIGFTEDQYDATLAFHEATKARGESWGSVEQLARAHRRWVQTGRLPGKPRPGEATLTRFTEGTGPSARRP